ncbi:Uma2 family endonuclease [Pendulispora rubella]|uniref:Uma2 family endonuclease n=1 Tax=Pendulispora rubella TaxID=2741070 RepID=A0ABZ2LIL9_9BACT
MSAAVSRKPRATLADWKRLTEDGHVVELIDGEIVEQSMGRPEHGRPQLKIGELLGPFNRRSGGPKGPGGWWLMSEVDIQYPKTEEIYRHDASGFRRDIYESPPTGNPTRDLPQWVCEILSKSTARVDLVKKQRSLHLHGIAHYWILDPEHGTLTVHRHHADGYIVVATGGVGDVIRAEPFDAIELDVGEFFGHDPVER